MKKSELKEIIKEVLKDRDLKITDQTKMEFDEFKLYVSTSANIRFPREFWNNLRKKKQSGQNRYRDLEDLVLELEDWIDKLCEYLKEYLLS